MGISTSRSLPEKVKSGDPVTAARWNALAEAAFGGSYDRKRAKRKVFAGQNGTGVAMPVNGVASLTTDSDSTIKGAIVNLQNASGQIVVTSTSAINDGVRGPVYAVNRWEPSLVRCSDAALVAGDTCGPDGNFEATGSASGLIAISDYLTEGFIWVVSEGGAGGSISSLAKLLTGKLPARVDATTPGGPTSVTRVTVDSGGNFQDGDVVDVYSWVNSESKDAADMADGFLFVWIEQGEDGNWYWTGEDCDPQPPAYQIISSPTAIPADGTMVVYVGDAP